MKTVSKVKISPPKLILLVYAAVIIGAFFYFVILQHFGFNGMVFSVEGEDHSISALDILILLSAVVSIALLIISFMAFGRKKDMRLFVLSLAFFFFAVKQFLNLLNNFFPGESMYIGNAEASLSLLILLSFMLLMYKQTK